MSPEPPAPVPLPIEPAFLTAVAALAERALQQPPPSLSAHRLRMLTMTALATLAIRRWLEGLGVPYQLEPQPIATSLAFPNLLLGGRRVHIHACLRAWPTLRPSHRRYKRLRIHLWLPPVGSDQLEPGDLHLFTLAMATTRPREGPSEEVFAIPPSLAWRRHRRQGLGPITLQWSGRRPISVRVQGMGPGGRPRQAEAKLAPATSQTLSGTWHSLHCACAPAPLSHTLTFSCPGRKPWIVRPRAWITLRPPVGQLLLLGWLTHAELRALSAPRRLGPGVRLRRSLRAERLQVPLQQLRPTPDLLRPLAGRDLP